MSTFHFGKSCSELNEECSNPEKNVDCCPDMNLTCYINECLKCIPPGGPHCQTYYQNCYEGYYCNVSSTCTQCSIKGSSCSEMKNSQCCGDLVCNEKDVCVDCTGEDKPCNEQICCEGFMCSSQGKCEGCMKIGMGCPNGASTLGVCCNDLKCFYGKCTQCRAETQVCSPYVQNCCKGLYCKKQGTGSYYCKLCDNQHKCKSGIPSCCEDYYCKDGTCTKCCAVEKNECGEGIADCCTGLTCYDDTCQKCTAESGACTDAEDAVPCCGSLTCYDGTCQKCTREYGLCGEGRVDCCSVLTCSGTGEIDDTEKCQYIASVN